MTPDVLGKALMLTGALGVLGVFAVAWLWKR